MMKWFGIFLITILSILEPLGDHPYAIQAINSELAQNSATQTPLILNLALNGNQTARPGKTA